MNTMNAWFKKETPKEAIKKAKRETQREVRVRRRSISGGSRGANVYTSRLPLGFHSLMHLRFFSLSLSLSSA
jgi:hypothetical protein